MKKYSIIYLIIIFHTFLFATLACQSNYRDAKMIKLSNNADVTINFFGRVVDDHGQPVSGAEVKLVISHFGLIPPWFEGATTRNIKTDKDGIFFIKNQKGRRLTVEKIIMKNYDNQSVLNTPTVFDFFSSKDMPTHCSYQTKGEGVIRAVPDPKNPFVYRLRKKGTVAFLMKGGRGFAFTLPESGTYKGYDFLREGGAFPIKANELDTPKDYGEPVTCDLRAQATFDPNSGKWRVVLAPGNREGGIQASVELLYEAPATGYLPSLTFQIPGKLDRVPKAWDEIRTSVPANYLYLRSRKQAIYARISLGDGFQVTWRPAAKQGDAPIQEISFSGTAIFNPYGERILEEATDLPGDVSFELRKEVRAAYRRGERPEAPNLAQRVKIWEQSRPLVDKVKDWFKP